MRLSEYLDPENAAGFTKQTLGRLADFGEDAADAVYNTMMDPGSMVDSFSDVASGAADLAQGAGRMAHDVMMDPGKMVGALTEMHPMDTAALMTAPFPVLGDITEVANLTRRATNDDLDDDPAAWEYPLVAAPGGLAMFAGIKAHKAPLGKLAQAKQMAAEGTPTRDDIWKKTGWFEDVDGKWKFEIDDSGLGVAPSGDRGLGPASGPSAIPVDINKHLTHEELLRQYPDISKSGLTYTDDVTEAGSYTKPGRFSERFTISAGENTHGKHDSFKGEMDYGEPSFVNPEGTRSVMAHELQHGIQQREKFASGGSASEFSVDPHQQYLNLAGEAEARNVQTRLGMTPKERAATPPWETLDVPEDALSVRFDGGMAAMGMIPKRMKGLGSPDTVSGRLETPEVPREKTIAYHGSPHDFDKFTTEAIGTGEGAQAYGHGLYFAESEDVARGYRDQLKANVVIRNDGIKMTYGDHVTEIETAIKEKFPRLHPDNVRSTARSVVNDNLVPDDVQGMGAFDKTGYLAEDIYLEGIRANKGAQASKGSMYQVEIDASPDEFLDWDLPLSEQMASNPKINEVVKDLESQGRNVDVQTWRGETLLDRVHGSVGRNKEGSEAIASQLLRDKGIKGIRYKDGFSRGADGGTSNYVVFDENLISIARKYGIAIPAAAAMLARQTGQNPQDLYEEDST